MSQAKSNSNQYPDLHIESEILLTETGKYTRTNSLVHNRIGRKRLMKEVINPMTNQRLAIYYAKGNFDEFCAPIEAYDLETKHFIRKYFFKDEEGLSLLKQLLEQPNITKKILFRDLYTIYQHVQKGVIDDQFLHTGIDKLVEKYEDDGVKAAVNMLYSYYQLTMTSEYYFIDKNTGAEGILGGNIKMLSIIKMLQEKLSPKEAAQYCHAKSRYDLQTEAENYLERLSNQSYLQNLGGDI